MECKCYRTKTKRNIKRARIILRLNRTFQRINNESTMKLTMKTNLDIRCNAGKSKPPLGNRQGARRTCRRLSTFGTWDMWISSGEEELKMPSCGIITVLTLLTSEGLVVH